MNAASVTATAMTHGFTDGGLMESGFSAAFDIATSTDFHTRFNRHAGSQHVFGILVLVEANTYRKPLYDLHVIASRILRLTSGGPRLPMSIPGMPEYLQENPDATVRVFEEGHTVCAVP